VNPLPERRSPRQWLALAAVVLVLSLGCVGLGRWQWHRYEVRSVEIERIQTNYAAPPVPLDDVITPSGALSDSDVWRQARLTGHYLTDATVLLRNRPVGGGPGFHLLAPFVDDASGTTVVVDRGFLAGLEAPAPGALPRPPSGEVTVVVHLRQDEPASRRTTVPGQVHAISTPQVLERSGALADAASVRTVHAYGVLATETPTGADAPAPLPPPSTDPGSHLSYAFQWWVFALGLVTMLVVLFRRDRASRRVSIDDILASSAAGDELRAGVGAQAAATARARRRQANDEAALEDDLIESQLAR